MRLPAEVFASLKSKARAHWNKPLADALADQGFAPVWLGIAAGYGLHADGSIWQLDRDAAEPKKLEGMWADIAVIFGAKVFPELAPLAPVRGEGDHTCSQCKGSGVMVVNGKTLPTPCSCAGLGWVPARWRA